MTIIGLTLQDPSVQISVPYLYYVITVLLVIFVAAAGYYIGRFLTGRSYRKQQKVERGKMFDIEKALKDFWEHERGKLTAENQALTEKVAVAEKQADEYRKKAAGVGVMGLSKDKRTDMLLQLMLENEALEEKLYDLNLKMKQERDEYLAKEIRDISYKRILLSEILKEQGIQDRIRQILKDDTKLRKVELPTSFASKPLPEAEMVEQNDEEEEEGS